MIVPIPQKRNSRTNGQSKERSLKKVHKTDFFNFYEFGYLSGLVALFFYENFIHTAMKIDKVLPFLPLLFTSVYCSIGVIYFWALYYYKFMAIKNDVSGQAQKKVN